MIDMSGKRGSSFPGAVESRVGTSPLLVRRCCSTNAQPNNSSNSPATAGRLLFFLTIFAGRYTYAAVQNMFKSLQQNRMKRKGASRSGSPIFAICRRRWLRPCLYRTWGRILTAAKPVCGQRFDPRLERPMNLFLEILRATAYLTSITRSVLYAIRWWKEYKQNG